MAKKMVMIILSAEKDKFLKLRATAKGMTKSKLYREIINNYLDNTPEKIS